MVLSLCPCNEFAFSDLNRTSSAAERLTLIVPAKSSAEKAASRFESARLAQDELISKYSKAELEVIVGVFERFSELWEREREKLRRER